MEWRLSEHPGRVATICEFKCFEQSEAPFTATSVRMGNSVARPTSVGRPTSRLHVRKSTCAQGLSATRLGGRGQGFASNSITVAVSHWLSELIVERIQGNQKSCKETHDTTRHHTTSLANCPYLVLLCTIFSGFRILTLAQRNRLWHLTQGTTFHIEAISSVFPRLQPQSCKQR